MKQIKIIGIVICTLLIAAVLPVSGIAINKTSTVEADVLTSVGEDDKDSNSKVDVLCGDVNFDGKIDIADVIYYIGGLFPPEFPPPPIGCEGDVNADGDINIADPVYLINYLFIPGSLPPVEGCCD